mmetsp:Transcript_60526/g.169038  ORF Transcript_60526/g.169038 Transcript_60526/m.169038 type:complete len:93 (-) Transcript_60526:26-304(-)|eukprot:CAMPEP_0117552446 /NCGR_PEP_ID=MMETSP0784-20121206/49711_1 /TAXON_ID=39447 /ORGANISM="" /LENGTH=92 /DNA_ID=CAMNT_0005349517 /DNA_START=152 /DNA_END=430 /DNA_ORIENTATION=-
MARALSLLLVLAWCLMRAADASPLCGSTGCDPEFDATEEALAMMEDDGELEAVEMQTNLFQRKYNIQRPSAVKPARKAREVPSVATANDAEM